jgi:hypothetical protein
MGHVKATFHKIFYSELPVDGSPVGADGVGVVAVGREGEVGE